MMKGFKARREREQQEAIVRPPVEIKDPSAELFSPTRSWERDDPLQDSFLDQPEAPRPVKDHYRLPKLKFRNTLDNCTTCQRSSSARRERNQDRKEREWLDIIDFDVSPSDQSSASSEQSPGPYDDDPEVVTEKSPMEPPSRHPDHTPAIPIKSRSRSLPPARDLYGLSVSPPKTNFLLFSQRCAPSPTSASPVATTPVFELSAEEAIPSIATAIESESLIELEGSPVEANLLYPPPLHLSSKVAPEYEPEASPYNRFTAFTKSIHALNASLSPIEETEEEAASRRSSLAAQIHELPAIAPLNPILPATYNGGTSITPRHRYNPAKSQDFSSPCRNTSVRSSDSTVSTNSMHSVFSFEFSNSDTEKIYISMPMTRRESSAPSLTDVSSVDDFDVDLDFGPDARRSRSVSKRDTKLERFFGIRQYSVSSESGSSNGLDEPVSPELTFESRHSSMSPIQPSHKQARSSISIDELDLSLALENDPYRREIISMHKSILSKSQSKQDAKLEKFFGCDKDQIQIARKSSTGSRLAGNTDDLKYRSFGW